MAKRLSVVRWGELWRRTRNDHPVHRHIETTGIDLENDAIVEIASVDILREGGITNRQEILGKYLGESTWI